MSNRTTELRRRERRILIWSLTAAVGFHVLLFVFWPAWKVEPFPFSEFEPRSGSGDRGPAVYVDVTFGPPEISAEDGSVSVEPPHRVLRATRILGVPTNCVALSQEGVTPAEGRVRLRVFYDGHAEVLEMTKSSGNDCADEVITAAADALRYHWLPSERFPAPVDLIQPVILTEALG